MFALCPKRHHDDVALRQASMGFGDLIPMFVNRSDGWRGRSWRSIELLISDLKRLVPPTDKPAGDRLSTTREVFDPSQRR